MGRGWKLRWGEPAGGRAQPSLVARSRNHAFGEKAHRPSLPGGSLTASIRFKRAFSLLQERFTLWAKTRTKMSLWQRVYKENHRSTSVSISREAVVRGERCDHHIPKGRSLPTRKDPKIRHRSVKRGQQNKTSWLKSRTFQEMGPSICARSCLHLHICGAARAPSAPMPAGVRMGGCHSLPLVSSKVFLMVLKTQSGWRWVRGNHCTWCRGMNIF